MIPRTCAVALPLSSPNPYRYTVPPSLADSVVPGSRVVVPVRGRELIGIVTATDPESDDSLKSLLLAPDPAPLLTKPLLELAHWVSRYYAAPLGLCMRAMLPAALWGESRLMADLADRDLDLGGTGGDVLEALAVSGGHAAASALSKRLGRPVWDTLQRLARAGAVSLETAPPDLGPPIRTERVVVLTTFLPTLMERAETFGRAVRQRAAYEAVDALGGEASVAHLTRQLGFSPSVLKGLAQRGVACIESRERSRDPFADVAGVAAPEPTASQRDAISQLGALRPGGAATLFGVTGSGKTLVYLRAFEDEVRAGKGLIVLVPEIALTPQTVARVRGVFGDTVAVLHSGLSHGERVDAWRQLAQGSRRVAVGARSAVFAPVRDLAAIVVDEEHDASYKQGELPRYHARDVALRRGRIEGARVVLGSATPSLEAWSASDRVPVVRLPERIGALPLPPVQLIDMRHERRVRAAGQLPWSEPLDLAVQTALDAGDQVLLLLNRRGYARFLQCKECGRAWECPACSISLTVHENPPRLRCHYCGHDEVRPLRCPDCGATTQRSAGVGTQLLERWLGERFPAARLARMDADTTSAKWSHQRILDAVARHEVDVLFGTQMIAKGLDFPGVTLVGVVDADTSLHLPDFRAAERTFQLIAQVAGRAGRGPRGGRVLVQTHSPQHHALTSAAAHDYEAFARRELETRRSPAYPPHVGLVNVVISDANERRVADAALEVAQWFRGLVRARAGGRVEVVGPAPAPLPRINRRWRWHLLLRSADRGELGRVVRYASRRSPHAARGSVRLVFDRDPVQLL